MDMITTVLNAMADPTRRRALALLWQGNELCVCELMAKLDVTQSRMSRHLSVLRSAGLVLDRRDAQWVRYRRNPDMAAPISAIAQSVVEATTQANLVTRGRTFQVKRHLGASI